MNRFHHSFEIVIPVSIKDIQNIEMNIPYILKYLHPQKIILISSHQTYKISINSFTSAIIEWIDEDKLVEGLSIQKIKQILDCKIKKSNREGWYFQQFLKMGFSLLPRESSYYLIWDADTLPLNYLYFFDKNTNLPLFTKRTEFHNIYFNTINSLLGLDKKNDFSYISEHMLIDKYIMRELILNIEQNHHIKGKTYFEKILNSIEISELPKSGFSEFETYGTYVEYYYPNKYQYHVINSFRHGNQFFTRKQFKKTLAQWVGEDFQIISFENWDKKKIILPTFIYYILTKIIRFKNFIFIRKNTKQQIKRFLSVILKYNKNN